MGVMEMISLIQIEIKINRRVLESLFFKNRHPFIRSKTNCAICSNGQ